MDNTQRPRPARLPTFAGYDPARTGFASRWSSDAGPCWVRTASGTAGPRRARAVNVGESASQVRGRPPSRPRTAKQPGAGFESHLLRLPVIATGDRWVPGSGG